MKKYNSPDFMEEECNKIKEDYKNLAENFVKASKIHSEKSPITIRKKK
jgi:hypothetical protein